MNGVINKSTVTKRVSIDSIVPDAVPRPGDRSRLAEFPNLSLTKEVGVVDAPAQRHAPQHGMVGEAVDFVEVFGAVEKVTNPMKR